MDRRNISVPPHLACEVLAARNLGSRFRVLTNAFFGNQLRHAHSSNLRVMATGNVETVIQSATHSCDCAHAIDGGVYGPNNGIHLSNQTPPQLPDLIAGDRRSPQTLILSSSSVNDTRKNRSLCFRYLRRIVLLTSCSAGNNKILVGVITQR